MGNSVLGQQLERGGAKTKAAACGRLVARVLESVAVF
jgi:hypothetical protein